MISFSSIEAYHPLSSHLPGLGGKSETVYPVGLAALRIEGCVWSRRARGEGSGGEVEKALISQKELALDLKAMRVWLFESQRYIVYITCPPTPRVGWVGDKK